MRLIQVLCMVLTELSVGGLLLTSLLSAREIRISFFTFNSLLSAILAALALVMTKTLLHSAWWDVRWLGLTVVGATVAWGCFRLDKDVLGRLFLIAAALLGLVFGVLPTSRHTVEMRGIETTVPVIFDAGALSGTLLLGATTVSMILGHWYLLMRRLSFEYLKRFAQILLGTSALRVVVVFGALAQLNQLDPTVGNMVIEPLWSLSGNLIFFAIRVLLGLVFPVILSILVLRCVQQKANQAATGLLYVCEISVLFGELFAAYLLI